MLSGLRVLDLTRVLAGPYGTMLLADLGADVVKVEDPDGGDPTRSIGGTDSPYFVSVNRNKRSIAIDFGTEAGRGLLARLAARADVLWHNFRPDAAVRLGVNVTAFRAANPRLIAVSLTSFGSTGPRRDLPAFDLIIQAMSGSMSATGEPGGAPCKNGVPTGDLTGGLMAAIATLAALHERQTTGLGRDIDLSLLDCSLSLLTYMAQFTLEGRPPPGPIGSSHAYQVPYRAYRCADGRFLAIAIFTDRFWAPFCTAIDLPVARDPRFATPTERAKNREALDAMIEARLATAPRDNWAARLQDAGLPAGPLWDIAEALADDAVRQRGMVGRMTDGKETLGSPFGKCELRSPPKLGADESAVLKDWLGV